MNSRSTPTPELNPIQRSRAPVESKPPATKAKDRGGHTPDHRGRVLQPVFDGELGQAAQAIGLGGPADWSSFMIGPEDETLASRLPYRRGAREEPSTLTVCAAPTTQPKPALAQNHQALIGLATEHPGAFGGLATALSARAGRRPVRRTRLVQADAPSCATKTTGRLTNWGSGHRPEHYGHCHGLGRADSPAFLVPCFASQVGSFRRSLADRPNSKPGTGNAAFHASTVSLISLVRDQRDGRGLAPAAAGRR